MILEILLLAAAPVGAQPAAPAFEPQVAHIEETLKARIVDEDADPASFGIDGPVPLPNYGEVSPLLLRSGQPNRTGLAQLKAKGVKTVLSLRNRASADEMREATRLGMTSVHVGMNGVFSPSFLELDLALAVLSNPGLQPALVHCRYGKDRTGVTVAAYRAVFEGMPVRDAAAEAKRYGCCVPLFKPLEKYLEDYLEHRRERYGAASARKPD